MLKKRGAIYSVVALMLCTAVYLNWNYNKNHLPQESDDDPSTAVNANISDNLLNINGNPTSDLGYFADARLSRQKARDEAVNILNSTIKNDKADKDAIASASAQIETMANNAMVESRIETLIIAKGYKECVTYVNDESVNVIIAKTGSGLTDTDVAKIKDIVIDEAEVTADKIKIIEKEQ